MWRPRHAARAKARWGCLLYRRCGALLRRAGGTPAPYGAGEALDFTPSIGYLPLRMHLDASPVVTLTSVFKLFGRFAALRDVTAEFKSGRLYAILGNNGAGKTTLLRVLAGLAQPTRGTVSILGTTKLRSVCHELGYMAHPSLLYDEMSGMENLRYFARLYGISDLTNNDPTQKDEGGAANPASVCTSNFTSGSFTSFCISSTSPSIVSPGSTGRRNLALSMVRK